MPVPHKQELDRAGYHLMNNFVQLRSMLLERLTTPDAETNGSGRPDERRLNAYLAAAAINQVVEDYIHRDSVLPQKAASRLERTGRPQASHIGKAIRVAAANMGISSDPMAA